jgi:hypothetical protein
MAIYYMDPHATVVGTGTWASPWSFNSTARTGLASGDEIRVKGVPLTSLLTATVYTATLTSSWQLTVTAGGGLGADFVVDDIVYIEGFDTFFRVNVVNTSTNVISTEGTTTSLPINNWSTTTVTVRRVNKESYPGPNSANFYVVGTGVPNLTVTDCWVDATTRVTDGSVKSLIYQGSAATNQATTFWDSNGGTTGWNLDFSNTHILGQRNAATTYTSSLSQSTVVVGQVYAGGVGYNSNGVSIPTNSTLPFSLNFTIKHMHGRLGGGGAANCTINIDNIYPAIAESWSNGLSGENLVVNIGNINCQQVSSFGLHYTPFGTYLKATFNYNGTVDIFQNDNLGSRGIVAGTGNQTINFGPSFQVLANRRATQLTSSFCIYNNWFGSSLLPKMIANKVNLPSGWTITGTDYLWSGIGTVTTNKTKYQQAQGEIQLSRNSLSVTGNMSSEGNNWMFTFRNGDAPIEYLNACGAFRTSSYSIGNYPLLTRDTSVFRTSGPSLKSTVTTRNSDMWVPGSISGGPRRTAIKPIKVPCQNGVPVTVTGYIRNSITGFANGDVRVGIYLQDTEITSQNITTASNGAWEQFTLSFTPTLTAEYTFIWEMFYATAGSIWLDDLTIL